MASNEGSRAGIRFIATCTGLLVLFQVLLGVFVWESTALERYLAWNAWLASRLVGLWDGTAAAFGNVLATAEFSVEVKRGCDGLQPLAIFFAAVLAFPAAWKHRAVGLLGGALLLLGLNVARIASLVVIGAKAQSAFELAHMTIWPGFLILVAFAAWAAWAVRVVAPSASRAPLHRAT